MIEELPTIEQSCKDKVFSRIQGEAISPRSKLLFQGREFAVWALWVLSVVVGAFSVAVVGFVLTHHEYALYEATHENFTTFIVEALPYLWIVTFGIMGAVAIYNLRHTKHGYRYPLWQVFGSSVLLSLVGGGVLHVFGFGYSVDHMLGRQMPMYISQEKMESQMWQNPEDGRLLGRVTKQMQPPSTLVTFTDINGHEWKIDTIELSDDERDLLFDKNEIKLIGQISPDDAGLFHSCGAFKWLLDKPVSREDFEAARQVFELKMHIFEARAEKLSRHEDVDSEEEDTQCGKMAPMERLGRRMMHQ